MKDSRKDLEKLERALKLAWSRRPPSPPSRRWRRSVMLHVARLNAAEQGSPGPSLFDSTLLRFAFVAGLTALALLAWAFPSDPSLQGTVVALILDDPVGLALFQPMGL